MHRRPHTCRSTHELMPAHATVGRLTPLCYGRRQPNEKPL
jgi:hypothetical protein